MAKWLRRLGRTLRGPPLQSDCSFCGRRCFVCRHDERRCVKGHVHFRNTVPRITLKLGA